MKLIPFNIDNKQHIQFMYDVRTAPEVAKNLFGNPPATFEQHYQWLEKQKSIRDIFLIEEEIKNDFGSDKEPIGYCHIYNIKNETVEVGWAFHPKFHRKGYGKEAVEVLIKECGKNYAQRDIELYVKNDNVPAIILYIKAGFVPLTINNNVIYMKKKIIQ